MRTSEHINEIAAALAKAQGAIEGAKKDSVNPHFKNKYADLAAVRDACRDPLAKNDLAAVQAVGYDAEMKRVLVTRLVHSSGQWIEDEGVPLILPKEDMQGLGSALTYSRRYGLMGMVGIAPEDDDGNAASHKHEPTKVETHAPKPNGAVLIPEGAVLIQHTKQRETTAGKLYWEIVLQSGETLMTWSEVAAKFAEQRNQDGKPVRLQVRGKYHDMGVIQSMTPADPPAPPHELSAAEIFNRNVPEAERPL